MVMGRVFSGGVLGEREGYSSYMYMTAVQVNLEAWNAPVRSGREAVWCRAMLDWTAGEGC